MEFNFDVQELLNLKDKFILQKKTNERWVGIKAISLYLQTWLNNEKEKPYTHNVNKQD